MAVIVECRRHCNWSKKKQDGFRISIYLMVTKTGHKPEKYSLLPQSALHICIQHWAVHFFFAKKKKEKEMQWKVSEKSSFHFWSANALIAFVTNVEYQDGKSPKEKLKGSLSWKNKNYFFSTFFSLNWVLHAQMKNLSIKNNKKILLKE